MKVHHTKFTCHSNTFLCLSSAQLFWTKLYVFINFNCNLFMPLLLCTLQRIKTPSVLFAYVQVFIPQQHSHNVLMPMLTSNVDWCLIFSCALVNINTTRVYKEIHHTRVAICTSLEQRTYAIIECAIWINIFFRQQKLCFF